MWLRVWITLGAALLLAGCYGTPPASPDPDGPRIRLVGMNAVGRPAYDSTETPPLEDNHCVKVPNFPATTARIGLSLRDPGGHDRVVISILAGNIVEDSLAAAPSWTVSTSIDRGTERTTITFTPPTGSDRVLTSALVVFNVTAVNYFTALGVTAADIASNRTNLYQVGVQSSKSGLRCRGEPPE